MLLLVRKEGELLPQVPGDVPVIELAPGAKRTSWALAALARELRRLRPTVAFGVHTSPSRLLCALPAAGKGLQVVCYETDPFRRVEAPKRMYGLRRAVTSVLYRRASAIVAASEVVADDLRRELRLPAERIRLIPKPCIDEDLEARAAEPVTHPAFTGAVPVVIAVGGLYVHKRPDLLLKAFARVLDEQPAELILLGAGPEEASLRSLAHDLGVAERVHFLGYQADPFKYMAKSDIFVSPSTRRASI
jgi:glycosyltransferase involved in cell wall biosynthesis